MRRSTAIQRRITMKPEETSELDTQAEQDLADTGSEVESTTTNGHTPEARQRTAKTEDTFPIQGIDYIEFYVGNAKQAAHYYRTVLGFSITAYAGPETKVRDRASYVLE